MTYEICEKTLYHVYSKTQFSSRSIFYRIQNQDLEFRIGKFTSLDPVHSTGTVSGRSYLYYSSEFCFAPH